MPRMSCPYSAMAGLSAGGSQRMSFPETPLFKSRQSQAESADTNTDHVYKNEYVCEDDKLLQVKHTRPGTPRMWYITLPMTRWERTQTYRSGTSPS